MSALVDGPWKDWIPGVLNDAQLKELCKKGLISGRSVEALEAAVGLSSIDLSLSDEGYELIEGAVSLPNRSERETRERSTAAHGPNCRAPN